jgi:hypothetical protein
LQASALYLIHVELNRTSIHATLAHELLELVYFPGHNFSHLEKFKKLFGWFACQRTPRKAGGLRGVAVSKTVNGYLEPTVLVDLFLLTDILLDSLQFKTHCRYRITTCPEMLTG